MRPPSASSGSSAWVRKNTPLTWTLNSRSNCASVVSAKLAISPWPALLTRWSKRVAAPGLASAARTLLDEAGKRGDVADVELQRDRLAAERLDLGHDGLGSLGAAAVGEDDVAAAARDADGGVAAEAAAAAGDDRRVVMGNSMVAVG